jgi:hypothetical protein
MGNKKWTIQINLQHRAHNTKKNTTQYELDTTIRRGPGWLDELGTTHTSLSPIRRARLCILQKGCTRLAAASDKAYQLLAHGRWFSPGFFRH